MHSYEDSLDFGLIADRYLVPDLWHLVDLHIDEIARLFEATGAEWATPQRPPAMRVGGDGVDPIPPSSEAVQQMIAVRSEMEEQLRNSTLDARAKPTRSKKAPAKKSGARKCGGEEGPGQEGSGQEVAAQAKDDGVEEDSRLGWLMVAVPTVGFIGLGNMGGPMCRRLVGAGYEVTAFDVDDEALDRAVEAGAARGASAVQCAASADILLTSLPRPGPRARRHGRPRRFARRDEAGIALDRSHHQLEGCRRRVGRRRLRTASPSSTPPSPAPSTERERAR